ncbi:Uncharacterised protein [Salmonella enterica subsp. enterica serovar Bovismorbificans]|uniref:Uncharacterized protein n=1 Tax=Salmonella enterica subsp. enterica serovar Bovismorbificans TaxID=58097 RepID=A0A655EM35_SALET|nr:Uncharacterised protein [Salmonella enterica subsp. enterica serovar Bovismorbificans]CNV22941.1 Uncharacterised protein [Salmonella enterica subsp. enterica serovar Bovismorbificans]CNV26991.1 Uncharacterised protein [Salmonella enterica subsp. enterica serovar Bovismorbificans]CNV30812.1 Uncharacterised protein [Salmonella enterica subsp. enterica serovar Bovismorbificans]CPR80511.1 Uncharacterised protein [Salmonella enterica subsp. enterica serovar Bovismorbificans]
MPGNISSSCCYIVFAILERRSKRIAPCPIFSNNDLTKMFKSKINRDCRTGFRHTNKCWQGAICNVVIFNAGITTIIQLNRRLFRRNGVGYDTIRRFVFITCFIYSNDFYTIFALR